MPEARAIRVTDALSSDGPSCVPTMAPTCWRSYRCQPLTTPRLIQAGREFVDDLFCFSEPYARVELPIALDSLNLPALPCQCCHILFGSRRCLTETVAAAELPGVVQLASRQEQPCSTEETLPGVCEDTDDDPGHAPGRQDAASPITPACPVSVRPRRSAFLHRRKVPKSAHSKRSFGRCVDRTALAQLPGLDCLSQCDPTTDLRRLSHALLKSL